MPGGRTAGRHVGQTRETFLKLAERPEGVTFWEVAQTEGLAANSVSPSISKWAREVLDESRERRARSDGKMHIMSVFRVKPNNQTMSLLGDTDNICRICDPPTEWKNNSARAVHASRIHKVKGTSQGAEYRRRRYALNGSNGNGNGVHVAVQRLRGMQAIDEAVQMLFGNRRLPTTEFVQWLDLTRELMNGGQ